MPPLSVGPAGFASAPAAPAVKAPQVAPDAAASATAVVAPAHPQVQAPQPLQIDPVAMKKQLSDVAELLNRQLERHQSNLGFSVDEVTNSFVLTVRDKSTNEIIRQIPAQAVLSVAHSIESLRGILYHGII